MAEVRGQFFGDVSGKVGGSVFSRAQNGKQLKAYVYLNQAPTSAQSIARSAFKSAKDAWNLFDYTEKKLWSGYADFNKFKGSGYSFFIHCSILGIEPMPSSPYSYYNKVSVSPADFINIDVVPIVLVPAPGSGKLLIPRSCTVFCSNFLYEYYNQNIYINSILIFNLISVLSQVSPLFCEMFPSVPGGLSCVGTWDNLPIMLSDVSHGLDDGGSTDVIFNTEYSIINYPF